MGRNRDLTAVYDKLPASLQDVACTAYGFYFSRRRDERRITKHSNGAWKSLLIYKEELKKEQSKSLSEMLTLALQSPFWESEFQKYGIDVSGDPYFQLAKLPIYNKQIIRDNAKNIVIGNPKDLLPVKTSGSTGAGLQFFESRDAEKIRWAYVWRFRQQIGIQDDDWCGYFCGRTIVPANEKSRFHRLNYYSKQILFSCYHLSKDTISSYVRVLNRRKPRWIHGYPSFLSEVSFLANQAGLELSYVPHVITTSSENLAPHQGTLIRSFFRTEIRSIYGMTESVVYATQILPCSNKYVVDELFSYVEFIKNNGSFKIVGTNLINRAFPMFRYDTGDLASEVDTTLFPRLIGRIDGRQEDSVLLPNGARVGRLDHVFKDASFVNEAQITQKELDAITVKVVKNDELWDDDSLSLIEQEFRTRLGDSLSIRIEIVDSIAKTSSGKLRFVVSELDSDCKP